PSIVIHFIANIIITNAKNAKYTYADILKITNKSVKQNKHQLDSLYHNFKTKSEHYLYQTNQNIEHNYKATISIARGM
ncbi:exodeoxyribonuclease VII large subunit, partial [Francisella tularensis subsp. holarctica]|nr:exodeoxyribonuclease VII large subunit [Francisella tularensis subsp. holarctica]